MTILRTSSVKMTTSASFHVTPNVSSESGIDGQTVDSNSYNILFSDETVELQEKIHFLSRETPTAFWSLECYV